MFSLFLCIWFNSAIEHVRAEKTLNNARLDWEGKTLKKIKAQLFYLIPTNHHLQKKGRSNFKMRGGSKLLHSTAQAILNILYITKTQSILMLLLHSDIKVQSYLTTYRLSCYEWNCRFLFIFGIYFILQAVYRHLKAPVDLHTTALATGH